jgi:hypothetical protein
LWKARIKVWACQQYRCKIGQRKILADFLDNNPKTGICGENLFDENKKPDMSYGMFGPSIW